MDQLFTPISTTNTNNTTPSSDGRTRLDKAFEMLLKEQEDDNASHYDDNNNNNNNKAPNLSGTIQSILNLLKDNNAIHPGLEDFNEVMVKDNYADGFRSNDDTSRNNNERMMIMNCANNIDSALNTYLTQTTVQKSSTNSINSPTII